MGEPSSPAELETHPESSSLDLAGELPAGAEPVHCGTDGHCITCSDEAIPMRVLEVSGGAGVALCEDGEGRRSEVLIGLLDDVVPGEFVLVHAGAALARDVAIGNPQAREVVS